MAEEKNYILEVGVGTKPFSTQGTRRMERDEVYIGVDTGSLALMAKKLGRSKGESLEKAWERINQRLPKRNRYHLMYADGTYLPFPDHSVSEVVFINTLGYPVPEEHILGEEGKQTESLVVEASRILKPGGLVTVVETLSPNTLPFPRLNELMRSIGFKCLTPAKDIESLKSILEYTENPYLRPDIKPTTYSPNRPYCATFQHR